MGKGEVPLDRLDAKAAGGRGERAVYSATAPTKRRGDAIGERGRCGGGTRGTPGDPQVVTGTGFGSDRFKGVNIEPERSMGRGRLGGEGGLGLRV